MHKLVSEDGEVHVLTCFVLCVAYRKWLWTVWRGTQCKNTSSPRVHPFNHMTNEAMTNEAKTNEAMTNEAMTDECFFLLTTIIKISNVIFHPPLFFSFMDMLHID